MVLQSSASQLLLSDRGQCGGQHAFMLGCWQCTAVQQIQTGQRQATTKRIGKQRFEETNLPGASGSLSGHQLSRAGSSNHPDFPAEMFVAMDRSVLKGSHRLVCQLGRLTAQHQDWQTKFVAMRSLVNVVSACTAMSTTLDLLIVWTSSWC